MARYRRTRVALHPRTIAEIEKLLVPEEPAKTAERQALMEQIDDLDPGVCALLNEYGTNIVGAMLADGYNTVDQLELPLRSWRDRRQSEWLQTNYITPRVGEKFREALLKWTRRPKVP